MVKPTNLSANSNFIELIRFEENILIVKYVIKTIQPHFKNKKIKNNDNNWMRLSIIGRPISRKIK